MSGEDVTNLLFSIEDRVKNVHTQSLDISFNELLAMHHSDPPELDISPDYQRLFRWSEGARSRFIESLILEMPVPPIYVIEEEEGTYLLIDGLQRISSYLHLRGELQANHLEPKIEFGEKLKLCDCDIVPELNGKTFDELGTALQIRLKRAFIRVEVVRKGSDARFKYHMFKRLNTGGELLTDQQLRNCTIRLLNPSFADLLIELSDSEEFKDVKSRMSKDRILGGYDKELILRFFALKNNMDGFVHNVVDFLTEYMESVSDPAANQVFDESHEKDVFKKTFEIFHKTLGEHAFARVNPDGTSIGLGFSVYHFEAFSIGIQSKLNSIDTNNEPQLEKLRNIFEEIKRDWGFIGLTTGGGKNSRGPLKDRIAFVQDRVERDL